MLPTTIKMYGLSDTVRDPLSATQYGFVRLVRPRTSLNQSINQHSSYGTNVNYHTKNLKNLKSEPCPEMVKISWKNIYSKKLAWKIFASKILARNFFGVRSDLKFRKSLQITTNVVYGRTYLFST